jgi:WD40 repeat protein
MMTERPNGGIMRLLRGEGGSRMRLLRGHRSPVHQLAFLADGLLASSARAADAVSLWGPHSDRPLTRLRCHGRLVRTVVGAPQTNRLAAVSTDHLLTVWDATYWAELDPSDGHGSVHFNAVVMFLDGGRCLAQASPGGIYARWWDGPTRPEIRQPPLSAPHPGSGCNWLAATPGGERLAGWRAEWVGQRVERTVVVADRERGSTDSFAYMGPDAPALAFSPGGDWLAAGVGRDVTFWEWARRECRRSLVMEAAVGAVAYSADGRLVAAGDAAGVVRVWDAADGRELAAYRWPVGAVQALAFAPDGLTAAAGGEGGDIVVWDLDV